MVVLPSKIVEEHAEATISDQTFAEALSQGEPIHSKEELFYYRIFQKSFSRPIPVNLVGKWNQTFH